MATALLDEWTEEKCLKLIREYRSKPILWDKRDPLFFKKKMKPIAWQEIGAAVNISADQCKHKMIILMSSFRREKAKLKHNMRNVTGDSRIDSSRAYRSTWFAFEEMAFLLDKDGEKKRQLNVDSDETDENDASTSTVDLSLLRHQLDSSRPAKRTRPMSGKKEFKHRAHADRREPRISQSRTVSGPSQTPLERDEEIISFTTFIGNKMKKYSDTTKNAVQQAICDIIFRADQNYYENNCYDKFTIIDDEADPLSKQMFEKDETIIKIQNDSDSE